MIEYGDQIKIDGTGTADDTIEVDRSLAAATYDVETQCFDTET
jgi:hypothetical protein